MASQKRKGRALILLKSLILFITCLSFFGILSCNNSGTGSTSSSGGNSGTGTGWTITINIGKNPISLNEVTSVMAIVKDNSGAPAPNGTNVCMTVVRGGFVTADTGDDRTVTLCEPTSNNLGQSIHTYWAIPAQGTGNDTLQVSSQGVIASATIFVVN